MKIFFVKIQNIIIYIICFINTQLYFSALEYNTLNIVEEYARIKNVINKKAECMTHVKCNINKLYKSVYKSFYVNAPKYISDKNILERVSDARKREKKIKDKLRYHHIKEKDFVKNYNELMLESIRQTPDKFVSTDNEITTLINYTRTQYLQHKDFNERQNFILHLKKLRQLKIKNYNIGYDHHIYNTMIKRIPKEFYKNQDILHECLSFFCPFQFINVIHKHQKSFFSDYFVLIKQIELYDNSICAFILNFYENMSSNSKTNTIQEEIKYLNEFKDYYIKLINRFFCIEILEDGTYLIKKRLSMEVHLEDLFWLLKSLLQKVSNIIEENDISIKNLDACINLLPKNIKKIVETYIKFYNSIQTINHRAKFIDDFCTSELFVIENQLVNIMKNILPTITSTHSNTYIKFLHAHMYNEHDKNTKFDCNILRSALIKVIKNKNKYMKNNQEDWNNFIKVPNLNIEYDFYSIHKTWKNYQFCEYEKNKSIMQKHQHIYTGQRFTENFLKDLIN